MIVLGLMVLVVGLPFLFRKPQVQDAAAGTGVKLVLLTPHGAQIRGEFSHAYNEDRLARGLPPVEFDWRAGGTSDLVKSVAAQFESLIAEGREADGIGVDLFWGGGEYDHDVVLAGGLKTKRDGQQIVVPMSVPFAIDDSLIQTVYPEPDIGGAPLYHAEKRWLGVALSSFGIVFNRDGLARAGLSEPRVWDDLADPRLMEDLALADPNHSGSITAAYEAVLKRQGWNAGWHTLRRAFANSRYFAINSARVPMDVAVGEAIAGMCIDFYGRYEVGAMPNDGPGGQPRLGYVDPAEETASGPRSLTATNADPISLMRGAPSPELANDFAWWLLSTPAQQLWQRKATHEDGPRRYELRRQPIRRDVYADKQGWTDPDINPFESAVAVPPGTPNYFSVLRGVTRAMAIDNRTLLKKAWTVLSQTRDGAPEKQAMLEAFDAMPPELTLVWPESLADWRSVLQPEQVEDIDPKRVQEVVAHLKAFGDQLKAAYPRGQRDAKELAWSQFFERQYLAVIRLGSTELTSRSQVTSQNE